MTTTRSDDRWVRRIVRRLRTDRRPAAAVDADALLVLRYRNLGTPDALTGGMGYTPNVAEFRRQIDWLRRHFRVIDLREGVRRLGAGRLGGVRVAITFDNALRNVGRLAVPILAAGGIPATVFAATRFATGEEVDWQAQAAFVCRRGGAGRLREALAANVTDRRAADQLSWLTLSKWLSRFFSTDEVLPTVRDVFARCWGARRMPRITMDVRRLKRLPRGISIGSHTGGRYPLAALAAAELHHELIVEHERLASLLGRPLRCLAYPMGRYGEHFDERALALVRGCLDVADFAADGRVNVALNSEHALHRLELGPGGPAEWAGRVATAIARERRLREAVAATAGADARGFADAAGPLLLETPA